MDYTNSGSEVLEIQRSDRIDEPFEVVGLTSASKSGTYVDEGLTPGQIYYYKARISRSDGQYGPFSDTQKVTIPLPMVTWQSIRQDMESKNAYVYINWNSWYDVDFAYVLQATDVNGPYQKMDTLKMNKDYKALITDKTQHYYYRLLPVKSGVEGVASEAVMVFFP